MTPEEARDYARLGYDAFHSGDTYNHDQDIAEVVFPTPFKDLSRAAQVSWEVAAEAIISAYQFVEEQK